MTKREYKHHRKRCRRFFEPWITSLGLRWWSVEIVFYRKSRDFRKANGASRTAAMKVFPKWQYLQAFIAVNVPAISRMDDTELERAVVHELCHILVNEMHGANQDHEERTVTTLADAFIWTRNRAAG